MHTNVVVYNLSTDCFNATPMFDPVVSKLELFKNKISVDKSKPNQNNNHYIKRILSLPLKKLANIS